LVLGVLPVQAALIHRYSFAADATDSVGTAHGTLVGGATVSNGQVVLDGIDGYVDLPNDLFTNFTSITFETWVTDNGSGAWARIYDFGNSSDGEDQSGAGTQYMFLSEPANAGNLRGAYTVTGGGAGEQILDWVGNKPPVGGKAHIVWSSDSASHTARLYVNGLQVVMNTNVTLTPAAIGPTANNWLGRSQFAADAFFNGAYDEFRIYDGALSPFQVAINAAAGPDTLLAETGPLQSLTLTVNSNMTAGTIQNGAVVGNFANITGVNLSLVASYSSGNPNVLTVDAGGLIRAVGAGSATVSASYSGQTNSATITVILKPVVLAHRYSFTSGAGDSVGGANGAPVGNAVINNGTLTLDGTSALSLPSGVIDTTYEALTIEAWAHLAVIPDGQVAHLYGFGSTDASGAPNKFVRLRTHSGGNNSAPGINGGGGEQTTFIPGPVAGDVHIVVIYHPLAGYMQWYLNGQLANSNSVSALLSQVNGTNNIVNFIGQHVDGSGGLVGTVNEFRIYNGALDLAQLRTSLAAGPDNALSNAGTIQSVTVSVYPNFLIGTIQRPRVRAGSATVSNIDLTGVSDVTFHSSNTKVLAVLPDGRVQAVGAGTTTLTATYQGASGSANVSVIPQQTLLTHRYSFTSDASDSVGGAHGSLRGEATIRGGALSILNDPGIGRGSYLELPGDLIDGYPALTVEAWVNLDVSGVWTRIFDFGNYTSGGAGESYIFLSPHTGGSTIRLAINDGAGEQLVDNGTPALDGLGPTHIVAVLDPIQQQLGAVYTNGVLMGSAPFTKLLTAVNDVHNFVGRSLYTGDAFLNGTVDEFRIYYGALSASQIAANFAAGPDVVALQGAPPGLSVALSQGNIVISWPDSAGGFILESIDTLGTAANWSQVNETVTSQNGQSTVNLPAAGNTRFFRLRK